MYSPIKAEFEHTKIVFDEDGLRLERDDGIALPAAPTAEKAQEAREKLAEAILMLHGDNKLMMPVENLTFFMDQAERLVKEAFADLETDRANAG